MPNENIMGIPTRACINGLTKEDTERLKNALIKKIEDNETTVNVTEDGKVIVADNSGFYLSYDGNIIGLIQDESGDYIPTTEPYLPEDVNENPLAPPNDTIMTSANIAVDPRIVRTTGNQTIAGNKNYTGIVSADTFQSHSVSKFIGVNEWMCVYKSSGTYHGGVALIFNNSDPNQFINCRMSWRGASWVIDMYITGASNCLNGAIARNVNGDVEVWVQNITQNNLGIDIELLHYRNSNPVVDGRILPKPVVGDTYTAVVDAVIS